MTRENFDTGEMVVRTMITPSADFKCSPAFNGASNASTRQRLMIEDLAALDGNYATQVCET